MARGRSSRRRWRPRQLETRPQRVVADGGVAVEGERLRRGKLGELDLDDLHAVTVQGATDERQYDVSPDGSRFLMLEEATSADDSDGDVRLRVVLDWREELLRMAPVSR